MNRHKILLIENQITQFKFITQKLSTDFDVYPKISDFIKYMNYVRICLTKRYDAATFNQGLRREKALNELVEYIRENKFNLIIIDHILVGYHDGENGIHLAMKLDKEGIKLPIIFLSRTSENNEDVKNKLPQSGITNTIWVEKGYAGQGLGNDTYFNKYVKYNINELLGKTIKQMLDSFLAEDYLQKCFTNIKKIRNEKKIESYSESQLSALISFYNREDWKVDELEILLKNLGNEK
jgi:hypothetical protein